jgi:hypothetical protein
MDECGIWINAHVDKHLMGQSKLEREEIVLFDLWIKLSSGISSLL